MQAIEHLNRISNGFKDALGFQQAYLYTTHTEHPRWRKLVSNAQYRCTNFRQCTYNAGLELEDTITNRAFLYCLLKSPIALNHAFSSLLKLDQYTWTYQDVREVLLLPRCRWQGLFPKEGLKKLESIFDDVNDVLNDSDWLRQNTYHRASLTTLGKPLPYAVQRQIDKEPKGPQLPIKRRPFPWDSLRERKGSQSMDQREARKRREDLGGHIFSIPQDQALIKAIQLQNS